MYRFIFKKYKIVTVPTGTTRSVKECHIIAYFRQPLHQQCELAVFGSSVQLNHFTYARGNQVQDPLQHINTVTCDKSKKGTVVPALNQLPCMKVYSTVEK
jgi:hypothetical protein